MCLLSWLTLSHPTSCWSPLSFSFCLAQPVEYMQMGQVSEKTDTFAFGVVLCELLTGLSPADYDAGRCCRRGCWSR